MQRYDSYKDSGIQWLGEIPSHWEVRRVRMIVTSEHGISYKPSDITDETGVLVLRASNIQDGKLSFDDNVYVKEVPQNKKLKKGDIILCATNGSLSLVGKSTIIDKDNEYSFGTFMLALRTSQSERFINYQLGRVIDNYRGLFATTTINQITQQVLGNMSMALPPLPEQQAIASYLDTASAKIDEAIAQQQKMIDLLNERKQIIINNAVTKGLNPNAPTKPSGIDWIGNIPEHWEVCKIKQHCKVKTGKTPSTSNQSYFEDGDIKWFTPGDLNNFELLDSERKVTVKAKNEQVCTMFPANTVFLVGIGGTIGKVGYCESEATCNQQINAISPNPNNANHKYLAYFIQCNRTQIIQLANLSTLPIINQDRTGSLLFLVPPLYEQEEIVSFIEKKTTPLNESLNASIRKIVLLQERKQIIINDVVTGKVKVCNN